MSRGKYSPILPQGKQYIHNCYGQTPAPWSKEIAESGIHYDELTMFDDYDDEGYDRYGYSCFDANGEYAGTGGGVDRAGYTENDYLAMSDDEWFNL